MISIPLSNVTKSRPLEIAESNAHRLILSYQIIDEFSHTQYTNKSPTKNVCRDDFIFLYVNCKEGISSTPARQTGATSHCKFFSYSYTSLSGRHISVMYDCISTLLQNSTLRFPFCWFYCAHLLTPCSFLYTWLWSWILLTFLALPHLSAFH